MLLKLVTLLFTLGFASASRPTNSPVPSRYYLREVCYRPCFDICVKGDNACECGPASTQNMLACATCRIHTDEWTMIGLYDWIDGWRKACAEAGMFIPPLVIPTGTAVVSIPVVSTSTPSSAPNPTPSIFASPSAAPAINATSATHTTAVLIASILATAVLAGSVAALTVWYICVRRRRNTRFDLGDSDETAENNASPAQEKSVSPFRDAVPEPKPTYDVPLGRNDRPGAGHTPFTSNNVNDDQIPLLLVSHDGSQHGSRGNTSTDPPLSPSAASDGLTWASVGHSSELSDDGRPFVRRKKSPRPVVSRGIPAVDDPAADLVSGQELDHIATTIAGMLSTLAPPSPTVLGPLPPVYNEKVKI